MKNGKMQCKDIPEQPIMDFLASGATAGYCGAVWSVGPGDGTTWSHSIHNALPSGTPEKLALAKMRQMLAKGLIEGCGCGCRGDFRLSET